MKYAYVAPKSSLSPIFGTSNPGLYSSIASLTNFIGPGEAGAAPGHSEPLSRVRGAILELSPGVEVPKMGDRIERPRSNLRRKITLSVPTHAY